MHVPGSPPSGANQDPSVSPRFPVRTAGVLAAFFLSGAAGLMYEVCWIRRSTLVFGSTAQAVSTVLAVFFLGLALGSGWFGRVSLRVARPLALYAKLELALALLALASLPLFALADHLYGEISRAAGGSQAALLGARVLLVSLLLLPATVAMGGTLPLFCRHFVHRSDRMARAVGSLYALNTLGALAGTALAGFFLLPRLGVSGTVGLAAGLNVLAALLAGWPGLGSPAVPPKTGTALARPVPHARALLLIFLTGFTALGLEVLWTRFLVLVVRNTIYTYTLTLLVILAGIVIGSWIASRFFDRTSHGFAIFGALQVLTAVSVRGLMSLPPAFWRGLPGDLWDQAVLMLPAAVFSGASFPLAVRLVAGAPSDAGREVGRVAAVNILGGILGSLVTGFVLLPRLGTGPSTWLITGVSMAAGLYALLAAVPARPGPRRIAAAAAGIGLWCAIPAALGTRLPDDFLKEAGPLVAAREGMTSYLAVVRAQGSLALYIDGWWQGQSMKNRQIVAAHLPALLHPDPRRVLVVGVGVGQTPSRFLYYGIERLDCVDIEPRLFDLVPRYFPSEWMRDPRVRLLREDGRNYVRHTGERYDIISLEVGQVFRPGVAAFYTVDFYRDVRAHLREGGVASQFVPIAMLDPGMLRRTVSSFLRVFPHSTLWYNDVELLLVGFRSDTIAIDRSRIARLAASEPIHRDLDYWYWGSPSNALHRPEVLLAGLLCASGGLARLAAGAPPYTDDRPALEYEASRAALGGGSEMEDIALLRDHLDSLSPLVGPTLPPDTLAEIEVRRGRNLDYLYAVALSRRLQNLPGADARLALLEHALAAYPGNGEVQRMMGNELVRAGRRAEAGGHYESAAAINGDDPAANRSLGLWLLDVNRAAEATACLERAVRLRPQEADVRTDLGAALATLGRLEEAREQFQAAVRLAPVDTMARANLARLDEQLSRPSVDSPARRDRAHRADPAR